MSNKIFNLPDQNVNIPPPIGEQIELNIAGSTAQQMEYTSTLDLTEINKVLSSQIRETNKPLQTLSASNTSILTPNVTLSDGSTLYQITIPEVTQDTNETSVVSQLDIGKLPTPHPEAVGVVTDIDESTYNEVGPTPMVGTTTSVAHTPITSDKDTSNSQNILQDSTIPTHGADASEGDDEDDDNDFLNSYITVTKAPPPPDQQPIQYGDNEIKLTQPGTQVCVFQYNVLPPIGKVFRVNKKHNLVEMIFKPWQMYQADGDGNLHPIGLLKP
jgi:hypothetical protein